MTTADEVRYYVRVNIIEPARQRGERVTTIRVGDVHDAMGLKSRMPLVAAALAADTHLTRRTVRRVLERAGNLGQVFHNPAEYLQRCAEAINRAKRRFLVDGVRYRPVDGWYELGFSDLEGYEDALVPIERSIYDHAICDSQVEKDVAAALDRMDQVKLFIKLPNWFTVPTPVGSYNPDWAIVFYDQDAFGELREKLYLVRETKGSADPAGLREMESLKIDCAGRHFEALGVDYRVVTRTDAGLEGIAP